MCSSTPNGRERRESNVMKMLFVSLLLVGGCASVHPALVCQVVGPGVMYCVDETLVTGNTP